MPSTTSAAPVAPTGAAHGRSRTSTVVVAVSAGAALGAGTQVLQGWLPGAAAVLANSGVVWALFAFALGLAMPSVRAAACAGAVALVVASCSYYLAADWFDGAGFALRSVVIWSAAGIVAGSTFGSAGHIARRSRRHRLDAWALVAGVLVGEGLHLTRYVDNAALRPAGLVELAAAALITVVSLRRSGTRTRVIAATTAAALTTLVAIRAISVVFSGL